MLRYNTKRLFENRYAKLAPVACLLLVFLALLLSSSLNNSFYYHSGEMMFLGYSYLKDGNSFNPHGIPILSYIVSAVPLLFMDVNYPENMDFDNPKVFGQAEFLYYGNNDAKSFVFWSTIPFMLFGLMIGILVFVWARQLYGYNAGLFALTLFAFSPVMLAYSWTILPDIMLAGLMLLSMYCFWRFYKNPKPLTLVLCAVFFGLALATKPTSMFLLIIFLAVGIIGICRKDFIRHLGRNRIISLALMLAIIFIIGTAVFVGVYINEIHPVYTDSDPMYKNAGYARSNERLDILIDKLPVTSDFGKSAMDYLITRFPVPAPHFIQGLYSTNTIVASGKDAFFMGDYYLGTKWKLYTLIFMMKNSIPFLILLFLVIALLKWNMPEDRMSLYLI
ncbi:MAG: glycosyltransferase family 39 protein, partial [Nanoarchaeota archaeon]